MAVQATNLQFDYSKYGFRDEENYVYKSGKGLNEQVVRELSGMKASRNGCCAAACKRSIFSIRSRCHW